MIAGPNLFILIVLIGGCIALQVYLCGFKSKWPGLVLPIISGVCSLAAVIGLVAFSATTVSVNGAVISQQLQTTGGTIAQAAIVFLICNIPTAILLAIYFARREKRRRAREVDSMNIQDL